MKINFLKLSAILLLVSCQTTSVQNQITNLERNPSAAEKQIGPHSTYSMKIIFHKVEGGSFKMGEAAIPTTIKKPYLAMATPMTQTMFSKIQIALGETNIEKINPSSFKFGVDSRAIEFNGKKVLMRPYHPVESISYKDILSFISKISNTSDPKVLTVLSEIIPGYKKGAKFDLPTGAQHEFILKKAVTEDNETMDPMVIRRDDKKIKKYANYAGSSPSPGTELVTSKLPMFVDDNPFWIQGNVSEWIKDPYQSSDPGSSPTSFRGIRGGSWYYSTYHLLSVFRDWHAQDYRNYDLGFRLVMTLP